MFFPQLSTGVVGQYPLRKKFIFRCAINESLDGRRIKRFDPGASAVEFELDFNGLSDGEISSVEDFFAACEGRLKTFSFLDPAANLLMWSEDLSRSAWTKDPMLSMGAGLDDPWGSMRATGLANGSAVTQSVTQTLNVPGSYVYCVSVWLKSASAQEVRVIAAAGGTTQSELATVGAQWQRKQMRVALGAGGETTIRFGLELGTGVNVVTSGFQVEAQPAAGEYRRTTSRSGVYSNARFAGDTFSRVARGVGDHSTALKILARVA